MMDTHTPRIVGTFSDDDVEQVEEGFEANPRAQRPPFRAQRVFTEADEASEPSRKAAPRRDNIRQMPLRRVETRSQTVPTAAPSAQPRARVAELPVAAQSASTLSTIELAKAIQKLSTDLLVGAAVVTVNLAELAAHVFSLIGLLALKVPGQFVHTCLMALYWRASGHEANYGEAFVKSWNAYRNLLHARWRIGPFEISLSFLVGFALLSPLLGLKVLELTSSLAHLPK